MLALGLATIATATTTSSVVALVITIILPAHPGMRVGGTDKHTYTSARALANVHIQFNEQIETRECGVHVRQPNKVQRTVLGATIEISNL